MQVLVALLMVVSIAGTLNPKPCRTVTSRPPDAARCSAEGGGGLAAMVAPSWSPWGFTKIRGTVLGGPPILGNYPMVMGRAFDDSSLVVRRVC